MTLLLIEGAPSSVPDPCAPGGEPSSVIISFDSKLGRQQWCVGTSATRFRSVGSWRQLPDTSTPQLHYCWTATMLAMWLESFVS